MDENVARWAVNRHCVSPYLQDLTGGKWKDSGKKYTPKQALLSYNQRKGEIGVTVYVHNVAVYIHEKTEDDALFCDCATAGSYFEVGSFISQVFQISPLRFLYCVKDHGRGGGEHDF